MRNFLIVLIFTIFIGFTGLLPEHNSTIPLQELFVAPYASASENSSFQNTSSWFVNWWNKVKNSANSMAQWFQQKTRSAVGGRETPPINQYPALSGQNTGNKPNLPFPETISGGSPSQIGESPDQINNAAEENGTPGSPYKLEPNQFKKYCGQNTYVLYWRKGGEKGRDMAKPTGKGGGNEGARDYWQLPTCEELAKCHCCCNTCTFPQGQICPDGWCFSKSTICDDKKDCTNKCSNKCDEKCKKGCEDYKEPKHDKAFNRDCKCNQEGCPDSNAKDCHIYIEDPGRTDVEYTKKDGNKEQYFKAMDNAYFKNGNGPNDPRSKIIAWPNDKADPGYVSKLKDQKGVCCKCYQDGEPIK